MGEDTEPFQRVDSYVTMRCKFSPCGRFLHVAALDWNEFDCSNATDNEDDDTPMQYRFTLFLFTYRLCKKRPSRSPPSLVHHVRVDLGTVDDLSDFGMPYTLTWTASDLYLTWSRSTLTVMRVPLFSNETEGTKILSEPMRLVRNGPLPDDAALRKVYFFPEHEGENQSRVILGKSIMDQSVAVPMTPSICTFNVAEDLGGWAISSSFAEPMLTVTRKGKLVS